MSQHVIVIGGGIVGISAGIWLRRLGAAVTLIDPAGLGAGTGASSGNAGVLAAGSMVPVTGPGLLAKAPGMLVDRDFPLFLRWGYLPRLLPWLLKYLSHANDADTRRIAGALAPLIADAPDQHLALAGGSKAAEWIRLGDFSYAYPDRAAFEADAYTWALRAEHGVVPEIREGARLRSHEPGLGPEFGLLASMRDHGYIRDPGGYLAALGAELTSLGGKMVKAETQEFDLVDGHIAAVETDAGRIACDAAVLAAGAWSRPMMRKLGQDVPLESERGYHLFLRGAQGGPTHPVMVTTGKFVATPMEGGVRCAGIVEFGGLTRGPSQAPLGLLRRQVRRAFPQMTWEAEAEWIGHRPVLADSLPVIGEVGRTGVFAGFGHHHVGLTAGPATGRLLAQLVTGAAPNLDLAPYAPARFRG